MKHMAVSALVAALTFGLPVLDAEAKRLGGGGIKRSVPTQTTPQKPAQQQQAPQQAAQPSPAAPAAAAAAAPAKRSWMGPIAGLAAGLGLAALASHFGFGAALANAMTMVLIGILAFALIAFLMRRFGNKNARNAGPQLAGAGAPYAFQPQTQAQQQQPQPAAFTPAASTAAASSAASSEEDAAFEQIAKRVFIRMQAANDAGDQADLRRFTTPQMYAAIQQELLDRKGATQSTEVLQLDAKVIDRAEEDGQQIVSVRFWGLVRELSDAAAESFDEVWHLVRQANGEWAIAGIQPTN